MVDIHELLRARERGQTYLQWVDEDGLLVGMLSHRAMADTSVTLFYQGHQAGRSAAEQRPDLRPGRTIC